MGQSMDCYIHRTTESGKAIGPKGEIAVLSIRGDDDHMKNSHICVRRNTRSP
jgi:hypothetical protein